MKVDYFTTAPHPSRKFCLINVSQNEALGLIKSLASQLESRNANSGREESIAEGGEVFTIYVDFNAP